MRRGMDERSWRWIDPRVARARGMAALGLWWIGASFALLVGSCAPLLLAIVLLPKDANPIGLGLLAFAGTGLAAIGIGSGALTALCGLFLEGIRRER